MVRENSATAVGFYGARRSVDTWNLCEEQGCGGSGLIRKLFSGVMDFAVIKAEMGSPVLFVRTDL